MDDFPSNKLIDDLPTQNEVMQSSSNNAPQTPTELTPPPIYDNNNNNNNQPSPAPAPSPYYNPPPIYNNNVPQEVKQDNNNYQPQANYTPPPIYNNNIPQEIPKPSANVSYQKPQDPLSQNYNNYASQAGANSAQANVYDNQIELPPELPTPQIVEFKQLPAVKEPVYQMQPMVIQNQKRVNYVSSRSCCDECCDDCANCCTSRECEECLACFAVFCQCLAAVLSCLAACS